MPPLPALQVLKLLGRKERWLAVAAVRFLRTALSLKDEFYNRYLVKNRLLQPVVAAFLGAGVAVGGGGGSDRDSSWRLFAAARPPFDCSRQQRHLPLAVSRPPVCTCGFPLCPLPL